MYDYLIVGSGLSGATFAYQATRDGSWHAINYRQWLAVHRDLWQ